MNETPIEPGSGTGVGGFGATAVSLTDRGEQYLEQTRPWVRFMSVMMFIGAGLLVLLGISLMLAGLAGHFSSTTGGLVPLPGSIGGVILGMVYIVFSVLYIAPGVFLARYASAIKLLQSNRTAEMLEDALRHQKSFWRYLGILTVVMLFVGLLVMVLSIVAALFWARLH